ncbi:uncharacterized protein LAJ45_03065 [Morchella importuna]|uniref:uncharacterized protein n=1 Tax=Morchella importuna TaxID=1174673 RepID=UPI001E8EE4B3|nr:uncharacterized protein LAJ45_03065 [Morchella importuna]KAH8152839.1 hypothetical protein LAJ45_03065 [Morchella importuna]
MDALGYGGIESGKLDSLTPIYTETRSAECRSSKSHSSAPASNKEVWLGWLRCEFLDQKLLPVVSFLGTEICL